MIDGIGGLAGVGWVLVVALAAYRIWHLLAVDNILSTPRAALPSSIQSFLTCPWCAGFWIGAAVTAVAWFWSDVEWVAFILVVLAVSAVIGMIATYTVEAD